jgi:glycosyltransferase involved in cell wall biosynthesis
MTEVEGTPTVLMLVDFPFPGTTGSPLHCMAIARGLRDVGCAVTVVKYSGRTGLAAASDWEGINVHHVPLRRWRSTVRRIASDAGADVVYAQGTLSALMASALWRGLPLVVEVHSAAGPRATVKQRVLEWFETARLRIAQPLIITLSSSDADRLRDVGLGRRDRISVLYPPVDVEAYLREPRAVRAKEPVVLYAGNFHVYQGVDLLFEAAATVLDLLPDVRFRLLGGTEDDLGEAAGALAALADRRSRVEILGRVPPEAVSAIYEDADVVVMPRPDVPINRTTARKLGEYLACGRVLVATDVADHRELISQNSAGVVCEPTSAALASALVSVLRNEFPTSLLAQRAQNVALQQFASDSAVQARLGVLRAAVQERR